MDGSSMMVELELERRCSNGGGSGYAIIKFAKLLASSSFPIRCLRSCKQSCGLHVDAEPELRSRRWLSLFWFGEFIDTGHRNIYV